MYFVISKDLTIYRAGTVPKHFFNQILIIFFKVRINERGKGINGLRKNASQKRKAFFASLFLSVLMSQKKKRHLIFSNCVIKYTAWEVLFIKWIKFVSFSYRKRIYLVMNHLRGGDINILRYARLNAKMKTGAKLESFSIVDVFLILHFFNLILFFNILLFSSCINIFSSLKNFSYSMKCLSMKSLYIFFKKKSVFIDRFVLFQMRNTK